jgi:hypothetical protein
MHNKQSFRGTAKLAAMLLVTTLNAGSAIGQAGLFRGGGTTSCGGYLAARASGDIPKANQIVQWGWGYLAGHSVASNVETAPPDDDTMRAYLDKYCRDNPLKDAVHAFHALNRELGGNPLPKQPVR